jgi:transposase
MVKPGFLDPESRRDLIELARDGSVPHRLARRANALVLLDQGMSCGDVARVLFLDDDTIRTWYRLFQQDGFDGLVSFGYDGSACRLSETQQDQLKAWITETLPRTTGAVGAWIETEFAITYESRSGLVACAGCLSWCRRDAVSRSWPIAASVTRNCLPFSVNFVSIMSFVSAAISKLRMLMG